MWTLPFLQPHHALPLTSFYSEWLALVLGLAALAGLAFLPRGRDVALPPMALAMLALAGVLVLHYFLGRVAYGGQVLVSVLYLVWAVALMVLAGELRRAFDLAGIVNVLAWFLVAGGVLGAVFGLLQHYQISDLSRLLVAPKTVAALYGNVGQYNHFASYCVLALAALAYLYAAGRMHAAGAFVAATPLVWALGLSSSRSSVLFLVAILLLALGYAWRGGAGGRRLCASVLVAIAGFAFAQWLVTVPWGAAPAATETVAQRIIAASPGSSSAINIAHRLQLVREAWEMFLQAPLLGVGWGQFAWHDFEYRALHSRAIGTWPFNHAHNVVLHLLAETGLVGALVIAGGVLGWVWGLRRAALDPAHWLLVAVLSVIGVHSLLEHPLWSAYFLGMAAVALGLTGYGGPALRAAAARWLPPSLATAGVIYLVFLLPLYRDFERLHYADTGIEPGTVSATLGRAHADPVLRPYAELAISTSLDLDESRLREKLELNGRVLRFAPIAGVAYRQALLLALAGEAAAAARQLERAARVYPDELPTAMRMLAQRVERHPAELKPLLELATAIQAARR
jgi:O-antigen ligase